MILSGQVTIADVAELADATDLGSVTLRGVEVQILSSAQRARGLAGRRLLCTQEIAGSNPAGSTSEMVAVQEGQRWASRCPSTYSGEEMRVADSSPRSALFAGLVQDEEGNPVEAVMVGGVPNYVVEDAGFRRHIESETVDRQVIELLREQFMAHREIATQAMLQMLGKDDLFTKAMIDASIKNMDQIIAQGLPEGARAWLGMLGFRVIINRHGEVANLDMPEQYEEFDE
jgi:hypothetical protein